MKTTRNSPRARKERALARRLCRYRRLHAKMARTADWFSDGDQVALDKGHLLYRALDDMNHRLDGFITKEGSAAWDAW